MKQTESEIQLHKMNSNRLKRYNHSGGPIVSDAEPELHMLVVHW